MRTQTASERRRLYEQARALVASDHRGELTLGALSRALASSPRQLQRAYAQCGETTFREELVTRRMRTAAQLLVEQRSMAVGDVARLVGYSEGTHLARAFRRRYGLSPASFRSVAPAQAEERS